MDRRGKHPKEELELSKMDMNCLFFQVDGHEEVQNQRDGFFRMARICGNILV